MVERPGDMMGLGGVAMIWWVDVAERMSVAVFARIEKYKYRVGLPAHARAKSQSLPEK